MIANLLPTSSTHLSGAITWAVFGAQSPLWPYPALVVSEEALAVPAVALVCGSASARRWHSSWQEGRAGWGCPALPPRHHKVAPGSVSERHRIGGFGQRRRRSAPLLGSRQPLPKPRGCCCASLLFVTPTSHRVTCLARR